MMRWYISRWLLSSVSVMTLGAMTGVSAAHAQDVANAEAGATKLKAIVVTGEKMARSVKNTASSLKVISSEDIEKNAEAQHADDVLRSVPNLIYSDTVGAPVIRGMDGQGSNFGSGAFFGGTVPRVRMNVDGRNLGYWDTVFGTTSIWDVDTMEVFRGPQTTTQGANSIAGAIMVKTKDPTFTSENAAQLEYGSGGNKRASVMFSGPLIEDELAARFTLDYSGRNSFINYINSAYTKGATNTDFQSLNGHLKLLWAPSEIPGLESKLTVTHTRSNRPTSEAASLPYGNLNSGTTSMPTYDSHTWSGVHDISYEFENGIKLSNQFQYTDGHTKRVAEPWTNGGALIDYWDISNESRINFGNEDDVFSGVAGIIYDHHVSDDRLYVRGTSSFHDVKDSVGLFSEGTWRFADQWALTGGLRYQYDRVQRTGTTSYSRYAMNFDESFDALLPKISLAYDITPDVTVGALVNRGYNPGGVGLSFVTGNYYTFKPETLWNYELFTRVKAFDDRLTLNGNVFYSAHKNSQRVVPDYLNGVLYGSMVLNADEARSYGMELSAEYEALYNLRLRGSVGLLETELSKFTNASGVAFEGNEFGKAPSYTIGLGFDWDVIENVTLSAEVRHTDGYYSTDENYPAYWVDSYTVANARVTYKPSETWQLYAYVDNIFDQHSPTWKYDDRTAGGIVASMLEPREIGLGMKVKF
jgi:iron complex outermembrane recepter protein